MKIIMTFKVMLVLLDMMPRKIMLLMMLGSTTNPVLIKAKWLKCEETRDMGNMCNVLHANDDVDDDDKVEGGCVDTDVQGILASEEPSR